MTTKWKVIAGFLVLIGLLAAMAILGNIKLGDATHGFTVYQIESETSVTSNGANAQIYRMRNRISQFMLNYDPENIKLALSYGEQAIHLLENALSIETSADEKTVLQTQIARVRQIMQYANNIQQKTLAKDTIFNTDLVALGGDIGTALRSLSAIARQTNNDEVLELVEDALLVYANARVQARFFADTARPAAAEAMVQNANALAEDLKKIEAYISSRESRQYIDRGKQVVASYIETFLRAKALSDEVVQSETQLTALATELGTDLDHYVERAGKRMKNLGESTAESNAQGQTLMTSFGLIGIAIGIIASVFIIIGLIKILGMVGAFASSIAAGEFKAQINSREKGEIGAMIGAIQQIPAALQSILSEYSALEKRFEGGELDAKAEVSAYKGGFATLVTGTNAILDRFLQVVESIPSPVRMISKDQKVIYMNAVGREICGSNYKGKDEKSVMPFDDDNTPAAALDKALSTMRPASNETVAHPAGKVMDISYTIIPMLGKDGKLASLLQLITDITAIKKTQRTIMTVAEQAASISARVASASEELSALVSQASHGAEMQRSRVESTASAMTEMNSTVMEVARNAGQASEQSEQTRGKAADGANLVGKVVSSINQVNKVAATLQTNMHELGTKAESIGGVMNVISDIADQTNLLALNAAIEAARAGDAGRGFAVVADEVRKLAEKTMIATQEVGANIKAIQDSAHTNINEVGVAATSVTEATELANTSGQALTEIVNMASANSAIVTSIATAAEEQSATSEEINRAIEEINQIVTETATGMVKSSAAVQELAKMAQELSKVMAELQRAGSA